MVAKLISPGELLSEQFIASYPGLTAREVADRIGTRPAVVYEIIKGKRAIPAPTALRLARYFGNSPEFWINLQGHYDLERAKRKDGGRIGRTVKPLTPVVPPTMTTKAHSVKDRTSTPQSAHRKSRDPAKLEFIRTLAAALPQIKESMRCIERNLAEIRGLKTPEDKRSAVRKKK